MTAGAWHEISGVCTHPDVEGRGLAWRLIAKLVRNQIAARGNALSPRHERQPARSPSVRTHGISLSRKSRCASCRVSDRCRADGDRGACIPVLPAADPRRPPVGVGGGRMQLAFLVWAVRAAIPPALSCEVCDTSYYYTAAAEIAGRDSSSRIPTTAIARISSRSSLPRYSGSRRRPDSTGARSSATPTASRCCSGSSPPASWGARASHRARSRFSRPRRDAAQSRSWSSTCPSRCRKAC